MTHKPNLIKLAVEAAGGPHTVAERLGLNFKAVRKWWAVKRVPSQYIVKLCAMGGGVISPAQVLTYIDEHADAAAEVGV